MFSISFIQAGYKTKSNGIRNYGTRNTGGTVKHQRNNGSSAEQWNTGGTIGISRNSAQKQNNGIKKNTTDTERRHIEQITWQNAKQENKEFYGKVEPSQKALSLNKLAQENEKQNIYTNVGML